MSEIVNIHFLRPLWLILLLAVPFLWRALTTTSGNGWARVIEPHLLAHLVVGQNRPNRRRRLCFFSFWLLAIIALSGPTFMKTPEELGTRNAPLVILLELTPYMLVEDISPTRLKRAEYKILDVMQKNPDREVSLIAFAGDAHLVVPLTSDHKTIEALLPLLSPSSMPIKGARLVSALQEAKKVLKVARGTIVALTSTNLDDKPEDIKNAMRDMKASLVIWSFATPAGGPLIAGGRFSESPHGQIQLSKLNQKFVDELAKTPGIYVTPMTSDDHDIKSMEKTFTAGSLADVRPVGEYDKWQDLGPYLLIGAVASLALGHFTGAPILMLLLVVAPKPLQASLADWFRRDDQKAYAALIRGDALSAADLYQDDFAKGTAYYKAKEYDRAVPLLQKVGTASGKYNLGNALAQLGRIDEAISAYNEALALEPGHKNARFNLDLLQSLKDKQSAQNSTSDKQPSKGDNNQSQKDGNSEPKVENKEPNPTPNEPEKKPKAKDGSGQDMQQKSEEESQAGKENQPAHEPSSHDPGNKPSQNPQWRYYLDKIDSGDADFFKRKFQGESRQRQGGR